MARPAADETSPRHLRARLMPARLRGHAWVPAFAILIGLTLLADGFATPGRSLLPVYCEASLHRAPYFASVLVSVRLLLAAIAAFIGGALCDAIGQRRVFLLGLSGGPVLGFLFLTGSPLALTAVSAYVGFTSGAYYLGGEAYMLATVPVAFLGTATALLFGAQTLGGALGGLIAAPVVGGSGFAAYGIVIVAAATLIIVAGVVFLPAVAKPGVVSPSLGSLSGYRAVLRRRPVLLLAALRFVPTCYYGASGLLMPLLIYRAAGNAAAAAVYGTVSLVFASACQLVAGRICDRLPRTQFSVVVSALMTVVGIATAFATGSLPALYACGVLGIGLAWALAVAVPGLVSDIATEEAKGRTLAVTHVSWYAGMIAGTQVAGLLVGLGSYLPFLVLGLFNLLTVAAAVGLRRALAEEPAEGAT
jgi:MFS transporter, ACDE family, multidrug resistance protein